MKNSKIAYCSICYLLYAPVYVKGARGGGVTDPYKMLSQPCTYSDNSQSKRTGRMQSLYVVIGHFSSAVLDGRVLHILWLQRSVDNVFNNSLYLLCFIMNLLLIWNYSDPDSTLLNILNFDWDLKLGRVKKVLKKCTNGASPRLPLLF
jgi:hypothetical protein